VNVTESTHRQSRHNYELVHIAEYVRGKSISFLVFRAHILTRYGCLGTACVNEPSDSRISLIFDLGRAGAGPVTRSPLPLAWAAAEAAQTLRYFVTAHVKPPLQA
jgi:hypothetical protein